MNEKFKKSDTYLCTNSVVLIYRQCSCHWRLLLLMTLFLLPWALWWYTYTYCMVSDSKCNLQYFFVSRVYTDAVRIYIMSSHIIYTLSHFFLESLSRNDLIIQHFGWLWYVNRILETYFVFVLCILLYTSSITAGWP